MVYTPSSNARNGYKTHILRLGVKGSWVRIPPAREKKVPSLQSLNYFNRIAIFPRGAFSDAWMLYAFLHTPNSISRTLLFCALAAKALWAKDLRVRQSTRPESYHAALHTFPHALQSTLSPT